MWDKMMGVMDNWYFIGGCICVLPLLLVVGVVILVIVLTRRSSAPAYRPRRRP